MKNMGNSSNCSFWGIFTLLSFCISATSAQNSTIGVVGNPSPSLIEKPKFSPFRPSMAVIVGALTATFSITFLVLLYARHCKRNSSGAGANVYRSDQYYHYSSSVGRKNSGIDRTVVESLPVFRFGALRTQDELECAVCLNKFECSEVLRLLPKCSHAFHVECVDTWLDAHSTCPLCRFRVDPEDVLLVVDATRVLLDQQRPQHHTESEASGKSSTGGYQRVSGRHSSAGERVFQIVDAASLRRSVDSWRQSRRNKRDSSRKDGLLLSQSITSTCARDTDNNKTEHRIGPGKHNQRWSDVQPSDLLYLQSEMITSDNSRRFSSGSRPTRHPQPLHLFRYGKRQQNGTGNGVSVGIDDAGSSGGGRRVINSRSVSEITGISRLSNDSIRARNDTNHHQDQDQDQHAGLLSNSRL